MYMGAGIFGNLISAAIDPWNRHSYVSFWCVSVVWGSGYDPFFVQDCEGLPWWGSVVQLDWSTSQPSREWYTSPVNVNMLEVSRRAYLISISLVLVNWTGQHLSLRANVAPVL